MQQPIEKLMETVEWTETEQSPVDSGELYATHEGVLEIGGHSLRCYRLNNGQAVFEAEDFAKFFGFGP